MYFIEFISNINLIDNNIPEKEFDDTLITDLLCRNKFSLFDISQMIYTSDFIIFQIDNDNLVGIICIRVIETSIWEISLICSIKNKTGIASKLLEMVIDMAKSNNIHKIITNPYYNESKILFNKYKFNNENELIIGGQKKALKKKTLRKKQGHNKTRRLRRK